MYVHAQFITSYFPNIHIIKLLKKDSMEELISVIQHFRRY
jgi:hypothetical protein